MKGSLGNGLEGVEGKKDAAIRTRRSSHKGSAPARVEVFNPTITPRAGGVASRPQKASFSSESLRLAKAVVAGLSRSLVR